MRLRKMVTPARFERATFPLGGGDGSNSTNAVALAVPIACQITGWERSPIREGEVSGHRAPR